MRPGAAIATGALVSSCMWAVVCLAKIGSAANYFMEPCIVALVVLSHAEPTWAARMSTRARLVVATLLVAQVTYDGVAAIGSATSSIHDDRARAGALEAVGETCPRRAGEVVLADEPGIELMLNGRIVQTPFQATHLARRGRFPLDAWIADVKHDKVACLVMQDDLLERPLSEVHIEHDRFGIELRRALAARFSLVDVRAGYHIYRSRQ
jgi:hypothetical protein